MTDGAPARVALQSQRASYPLCSAHRVLLVQSPGSHCCAARRTTLTLTLTPTQESKAVATKPLHEESHGQAETPGGAAALRV